MKDANKAGHDKDGEFLVPLHTLESLKTRSPSASITPATPRVAAEH